MTTIPLQGRKKILNRAALPVQKTDLPFTLKTRESTAYTEHKCSNNKSSDTCENNNNTDDDNTSIKYCYLSRELTLTHAVGVILL